MVNPANCLPIMLRSGKRSDAAPPAAKQAKKRGPKRSIQTSSCRAKGAAPVRKDGRHGNWHPCPPQSSGMQACTQQAKRRRPAAKQAKNEDETLDSNFFHAAPKARPPSGGTGDAAIRTHAHRKAAACKPARSKQSDAPRREAGEKTRTKRSIQTSSMPRQRRGPRPQGRAARQLASVCRQSASANRLAPTPVPQRRAAFKNCRQSQRTGTHSVECWPALCESGKENGKPANFLPIMHRGGRRSRRRLAGRVLQLCFLMEPHAALFTRAHGRKSPRQGASGHPRASASASLSPFSARGFSACQISTLARGSFEFLTAPRTKGGILFYLRAAARAEFRHRFFLRCGRPARA